MRRPDRRSAATASAGTIPAGHAGARSLAAAPGDTTAGGANEQASRSAAVDERTGRAPAVRPPCGFTEFDTAGAGLARVRGSRGPG